MLVRVITAISVDVVLPAVINRCRAIVAIALMVVIRSISLLLLLVCILSGCRPRLLSVLLSSIFSCSSICLSLGLLLSVLLLGGETFTRSFIKINLPFVSLLEVHIIFWEYLLALKNFTYLYKVAFELRSKFSVIFPARCFINNRFDLFIFYYYTDVGGIMSLTEDCMLVWIAHAQVFKKLHPQVLQPVRVVLEKIEIVTYRY